VAQQKDAGRVRVVVKGINGNEVIKGRSLKQKENESGGKITCYFLHGREI
jgi:hypothetical protein